MHSGLEKITISSPSFIKVEPLGIINFSFRTIPPILKPEGKFISSIDGPINSEDADTYPSITSALPFINEYNLFI